MSRPDVEPETLLQDARRGDGDALAKLLHLHRHRLRRLIHCRLNPRVRTRVSESDVLQETFIAASRAIAGYDGDRSGPFYLWLRQVACRQLKRVTKQHVTAAKRSVTRELAPSRRILAKQLASLSTPSSAAMRKEAELRAHAALDAVPAYSREVLALRFCERLNATEMATVLEISAAAVRMRLMRALKRIAKLLDSSQGEQ